MIFRKKTLLCFVEKLIKQYIDQHVEYRHGGVAPKEQKFRLATLGPIHMSDEPVTIVQEITQHMNLEQVWRGGRLYQVIGKTGELKIDQLLTLLTSASGLQVEVTPAVSEKVEVTFKDKE